MITEENIVAALKASGPVAPGVLASKMKVNAEALKYHVKKLLTAGALKAVGNTTGRVVGLPDQDFSRPSAHPQSGRGPAKHKKRGHAKKSHKAPRAARAAERFIPTVDADLGLHIINGAAPVSYTAAQTLAIATLLFNHYKA